MHELRSNFKKVCSLYRMIFTFAWETKMELEIVVKLISCTIILHDDKTSTLRKFLQTVLCIDPMSFFKCHILIKQKVYEYHYVETRAKVIILYKSWWIVLQNFHHNLQLSSYLIYVLLNSATVSFYYKCFKSSQWRQIVQRKYKFWPG